MATILLFLLNYNYRIADIGHYILTVVIDVLIILNFLIAYSSCSCI